MGPIGGWVRQAAAIPIRDGRVCLINSSNGSRWVVPKGMIDPGESAAETALKEAWEEAGLVGNLRPEPVGSYVYEKFGRVCHVTVFVMEVVEESSWWPERSLRRRRWLPPDEAVAAVETEGLRELLTRTLVEGGAVVAGE